MCTKKVQFQWKAALKNVHDASRYRCALQKNAATFGRSVPIVEVSLSARNFSGKRGIRTPGPSQVNGFQDRRIRPLCHLSLCRSACCTDMLTCERLCKYTKIVRHGKKKLFLG